eukprot:TRINITY_DN4469_c0_g1_i4.p1 TRINITY_DN4469_c0_g1~~TRINITY_DN4469_c0_g1_i4.p1  ORF type:complete len:413 (+),score=51.40 TRINITY_DN4469_c0_g1_i4:39-1277(+)
MLNFRILSRFSNGGRCSDKVIRRFLSQAKSEEESSKSKATSYINKLLDNPLPLGVGALVVGLVQWKHIQARNREQQQKAADSGGGEAPQVFDDDGYVVTVYKTLPLRHLSRLWGKMHDVELPVWARNTVIGGYAKATGCQVSEAENQDLTEYKNLGAFFKRRLKAGCRPIDCCNLVSPCDGQVLHFGPIDAKSGLVEQVKGVTYSLSKFLGSYFDGSIPHTTPAMSGDQLSQDYTVKEGKRLYQCVLYLAPGDYHGFHSPVNWKVTQRRHFPGELLSVNPSVVRKMNKVFELNERAVYLGEWEHGFFSMTAVAATMVGGIKIPFDEELATNTWKWENRTFFQKIFQDGQEVTKGDFFGEFNLGSTIVLIFEAPEDFTWNLTSGQTIKMGQPMCTDTATEEESSSKHESQKSE